PGAPARRRRRRRGGGGGRRGHRHRPRPLHHRDPAAGQRHRSGPGHLRSDRELKPSAYSGKGTGVRLREVLSALTGTAFLIGVPLLLFRAGWPLSGTDAGEVVMFLRGGALPARLLAAGLITLAWAAWGVFALAVLADLARLVGGGGPRMAGLRLLAVLATGG